MCRSFDGPQGMSGLMQEKITHAGIRSRTVQPVASHYTDSDILEKFTSILAFFLKFVFFAYPFYAQHPNVFFPMFNSIFSTSVLVFYRFLIFCIPSTTIT